MTSDIGGGGRYIELIRDPADQYRRIATIAVGCVVHDPVLLEAGDEDEARREAEGVRFPCCGPWDLR
jgi:hypothetical protein